MNHTAIYLRVSTKAQDTASQEHDMARWRQNHEGECVEYRDELTGKTMNRPGWNELWRQVELGEVRRIVIWRIDRLGRTASGLTKLFDELVARKIGLLSLRDSLDLETPAGRLMANVLASVAAYETEVRSERIQAGLAAKRARGEKWGGSKPGTPKTLSAYKVRSIWLLREKGFNPSQIAKATGLADSTVRLAIKEQRWTRCGFWKNRAASPSL